MNIEDKVGHLVSMALYITEQTPHCVTCFVHSPTQSLDFAVYIGGWREGAFADKRWNVSFDDSFWPKDRILENLDLLEQDLKVILDAKELIEQMKGGE